MRRLAENWHHINIGVAAIADSYFKNSIEIEVAILYYFALFCDEIALSREGHSTDAFCARARQSTAFAIKSMTCRALKQTLSRLRAAPAHRGNRRGLMLAEMSWNVLLEISVAIIVERRPGIIWYRWSADAR